MRVVKEHEVRKAELLETSERLFREKGYDYCTVKDIVNELGLARATFFYYFSTKEAVLDEIIRIKTERMAERCNKVIKAENLSKEEKFMAVIASVNEVVSGDAGEIITMHKAGNSLMHQKSIIALVHLLTPFLTDIVHENEKDDREETENKIMIILSPILLLLDDGFFSWDKEKEEKILLSIIDSANKLLGLDTKKIMAILD